MPEIESSASNPLPRIWGIVVRGRWWILLAATVVTVATVAILYRIPNRYKSEATLLVVPQQVPARYVTPTTETNIADALQAMTQDVLSRARLLELIDQFGLYAKERQHLAPEEVLDLMRSFIVIEPVNPASGRRDINAFKISFIAEKPALAQQVTSKLTSFFIQANLKTREDQATNTTNFLEAQMEAAKTRLTVQEQKVRDFKAQYLGELPEQLQGNLAIFNGAQTQLQNLENSLDRAQQQRVYIESLISGYQRLVAARSADAPSVVPGSVVPSIASRPLSPLQTAQNDLARMQTEKSRLLITFTPSYPDVRALDRQIASTEAVIENLRKSDEAQAHNAAEPTRTTPATAVVPEEDASITQLKSQLESNRVEIEDIKKYEAQQKAVLTQYQSRLNLTPVREAQLADILRDYDLSKQDYADLLGKEQQSQLATSLEKQQGGEQFRLVEPPSLPDIPASPQRIKFSFMGLGGGLFLGLAIAFLTDLARPTFHTTKEIIQKFGAPLVVGLPVVLTKGEKRRRSWKNTFELVAGSVLALVMAVAEFYVVRHP